MFKYCCCCFAPKKQPESHLFSTAEQEKRIDEKWALLKKLEARAKLCEKKLGKYRMQVKLNADQEGRLFTIVNILDDTYKESKRVDADAIDFYVTQFDDLEKEDQETIKNLLIYACRRNRVFQKMDVHHKEYLDLKKSRYINTKLSKATNVSKVGKFKSIITEKDDHGTSYAPLRAEAKHGKSISMQADLYT